VLSTSTIDDPRLTDRQGFCGHHGGDVIEQGEVDFYILSECFIDIFIGDLSGHEGGFLRILWASHIVIFIISGGPPLQRLAGARMRNAWFFLVAPSIFRLILPFWILAEAFRVHMIGLPAERAVWNVIDLDSTRCPVQ
jgi:hypothetical protein